MSGYKSAVLVPFPNRIADGKYRFNGKSYQLPINRSPENNALHGLIYNKEFVVKNITTDEQTASITIFYSYKHETKGYPFDIDFTLEYSIKSDNSLLVNFYLTNKTGIACPVGLGWHPYFKLGNKIDKLELQLPNSTILFADDRNIPNGESQKNNEFNDLSQIHQHSFDATFQIDGTQDRTSTILYNRELGVSLNIWQEIGNKKFNYLQVYTPPSRDSIAIEPMSCHVDAFNNSQGLIVLQPHETVSMKCGVNIGHR